MEGRCRWVVRFQRKDIPVMDSARLRYGVDGMDCKIQRKGRYVGDRLERG